MAESVRAWRSIHFDRYESVRWIPTPASGAERVVFGKGLASGFHLQDMLWTSKGGKLIPLFLQQSPSRGIPAEGVPKVPRAHHDIVSYTGCMPNCVLVPFTHQRTFVCMLCTPPFAFTCLANPAAGNRTGVCRFFANLLVAFFCLSCHPAIHLV